MFPFWYTVASLGLMALLFQLVGITPELPGTKHCRHDQPVCRLMTFVVYHSWLINLQLTLLSYLYLPYTTLKTSQGCVWQRVGPSLTRPVVLRGFPRQPAGYHTCVKFILYLSSCMQVRMKQVKVVVALLLHLRLSGGVPRFLSSVLMSLTYVRIIAATLIYT